MQARTIAVVIFTYFLLQRAAIAQSDYFGIQLIDEETGRGVPLVELRTVNQIRLVTDSDGWIAFNEPGLMDREVYFHISGHGYEYPADGFGYRGVRLTTAAGANAQVKIKRINLAERLYRITGQGIYRDSVLLGLKQPTQATVLNGGVLGQDTVQTAILDDRVYWFWGDTNRAGYPLGQFKTSGAYGDDLTRLRRNADKAIELNYFIDENGFSRQMAPVEGPGAVWLHGLFVIRDDGTSKMIAHYARMKSLGERLEHGLVLFNQETETFEKLVQFDDDHILYPRGQAFIVDGEQELDTADTAQESHYIYFATPFASVRVRADLEHIMDPAKYQAFTCLASGTRYDKAQTTIDRDAAGNAIWEWRTDTDTLDAQRQHELNQLGLLKPSDFRFVLSDESANIVFCNAGSIHFNEYRQRWILIGEQIGGESSFLGEIWYAEAENPEGPWTGAIKIVTHDHYSFYNPAHHRFLDQDGGRLIYFDGTYATTFSQAKTATPRYDYNQVMYRLDLANPALPSRRK